MVEPPCTTWFRASEVAAAIGLNPYAGPSTVIKRLWQEHAGVDYCVAVAAARPVNPLAGCVTHTDVLRRVRECPRAKRHRGAQDAAAAATRSAESCAVGSAAEAKDVACFAAAAGRTVTARDTTCMSYVHPLRRDVGTELRLERNPWGIRGRVDGFDPMRDEIIESKRRTSGAIYHGTLPAYDACQVQMYMKLAGCTRACVVEHFGELSKTTALVYDSVQWEDTVRRLGTVIHMLATIHTWDDTTKATWLGLTDAEQDRDLRCVLRGTIAELPVPVPTAVPAPPALHTGTPHPLALVREGTLATPLKFVVMGGRGLSNDNLRHLIVECGGRVTTKVSKLTDYVVAGVGGHDGKDTRGTRVLQEVAVRALIRDRSRKLWAATPTQDEVASFVAEHTRTIDAATAEAVAALPQHLACGTANQDWLDSRKHKITGSIVGAILGMNKYCTPDSCLDNLLHPSWTPNRCTDYGNHHEDDAQAATLLYLRSKDAEAAIKNVGLVLCTQEGMGWCGQSPDGIMEKQNWLVEYKCPYGQKGRVDVPDGPVDLYPRSTMAHTGTLGDHAVAVPPYYYAQVQWGAGISGYDRIVFVVWAPAGVKQTLPFAGVAAGAVVDGTAGSTRVIHERRIETQGGHYVLEALVSTAQGLIQVTEMPRDDAWFTWALPRVRTFWEKRYVPAHLRNTKAREAVE